MGSDSFLRRDPAAGAIPMVKCLKVRQQPNAEKKLTFPQAARPVNHRSER